MINRSRAAEPRFRESVLPSCQRDLLVAVPNGRHRAGADAGRGLSAYRPQQRFWRSQIRDHDQQFERRTVRRTIGTAAGVVILGFCAKLAHAA